MGPLIILSGSNSSWDRNTRRRFKETLAYIRKRYKTTLYSAIIFKNNILHYAYTTLLLDTPNPSS